MGEWEVAEPFRGGGIEGTVIGDMIFGRDLKQLQLVFMRLKS